MLQLKQFKFQILGEIMLKSVFVLNSDWQNDKFKDNLLQICGQNHAIFYPVSSENVKNSNTALTKDEAISLLNQNKNKEILSQIISKFDEIKADFIIVVGGILSELDEEIALNLNAPFLLTQDTKFKANLFDFTVLHDPKDILNTKSDCVTPLRFELNLLKQAQKLDRTIVFPESDDERILKACHILLAQNAVKIILLGDENEILNKANTLGLNLNKAKFLNPQNSELTQDFANTLFELRKNKGLSQEEALNLIKDRTYFGTMLVHKNIANAMVSGASTTTAETIRPALQFIKTKPGISCVSGSFIMCLKDKIWIFADCAIMPNPSTDELAQIAVSTAKTAKDFGLNPKVAMLSYSTGDSGSGVDVDFVREALQKAKDLAPNLEIDGPMQFDAAVDKSVAKKKMPNSSVAGEANVFIFPNLNCGNITYKAVQRSANAIAIGPILQGLNKPVNDLSRGCLVEDIINTALISALQGE